MNILDKILETKREEIAAAKSRISFEQIQEQATLEPRKTLSFSDSLKNSSSGIIAEFKRKSPSKGFIKEGAKVEAVVKGYSDNGAAAVSVLTDSDYFGGSLSDLEAARKVSQVPLLRKDFIIDRYQICEARIYGADVILLIAAALDPQQCKDLAAFAHSLGLEVLLEIHNQSELAYIKGDIDVVGINNRDLTSFITNVNVSHELGHLIPEGCLKISESGISDPKTVRELQADGFGGFLMGENFMKESDPAAALKNFIALI